MPFDQLIIDSAIIQWPCI